MKEITLFANKPRCPKMNGYVERCHRTIREGFYQVRDYLPLMNPYKVLTEVLVQI